MVGDERKKRPPRVPLTAEEVAEWVTVKKIREQIKLQRFKKTKRFKYLNVFNVACFFIYLELLICFYTNCNYKTQYSKKLEVEYWNERNSYNQSKVSHIKVTDVNDNFYLFVINDYMEVPSKYCAFTVGKDFILQKELKGSFLGSTNYYRIQRAEPFLFLSGFIGFLICIIYGFNLNQVEHSLKVISIINGLTVFTFLLI